MFYNPTQDNARRQGSPSTTNTSPSELPLISPLQQKNTRIDVKK